ncbi:unnamed protein product, partial [Lepidochelys olivacea]
MGQGVSAPRSLPGGRRRGRAGPGWADPGRAPSSPHNFPFPAQRRRVPPGRARGVGGRAPPGHDGTLPRCSRRGGPAGTKLLSAPPFPAPPARLAPPRDLEERNVEAQRSWVRTPPTLASLGGEGGLPPKAVPSPLLAQPPPGAPQALLC